MSGVSTYERLLARLSGEREDFWDRPDGDWGPRGARGAAGAEQERLRADANAAYVIGSNALRRGELDSAGDWFAVATDAGHPGAAFRTALVAVRRALTDRSAWVVVGGLDEASPTHTAHEVQRWLQIAAAFGHEDARYLIAHRTASSCDTAGEQTAPAGESDAHGEGQDTGHAVVARPEQVQDPEFFDEILAFRLDPPQRGGVPGPGSAAGQTPQGGPVEEDMAEQVVPGEVQAPTDSPAKGPVTRVGTETGLMEGFITTRLTALYVATRTEVQRALEQARVDPWQRLLGQTDPPTNPLETGALPEALLKRFLSASMGDERALREVACSALLSRTRRTVLWADHDPSADEGWLLYTGGRVEKDTSGRPARLLLHTDGVTSPFTAGEDGLSDAWAGRVAGLLRPTTASDRAAGAVDMRCWSDTELLDALVRGTHDPDRMRRLRLVRDELRDLSSGLEERLSVINVLYRPGTSLARLLADLSAPLAELEAQYADTPGGGGDGWSPPGQAGGLAPAAPGLLTPGWAALQGR
ncbi:hypothetical protein ABT160_42345 [Streptomyces sp. NPDC001941]|uniref:hypothetical protein n=1 Tax=Streptomyces sp. NPDC001941 TaxID=3154659 RepID=UPI003329F108